MFEQPNDISSAQISPHAIKKILKNVRMNCLPGKVTFYAEYNCVSVATVPCPTFQPRGEDENKEQKARLRNKVSNNKKITHTDKK